MLDKIIDDLNTRNKLIRMEEQAIAGWSIVDEYLTDELASHSDDAKRMIEEGRKKQSVKGRLKHSIEFLENTLKANAFVIETINDGYKLPLKETAIKTEFGNNVSTIQNSDFVNEALKELIESNCVIEVQNKPQVINPLSVSAIVVVKRG